MAMIRTKTQREKATTNITCLYLVACAVERFVEPVDVSRKVPCGVGHACRRKGVVGERNVGERCRVGVEELAGVLPGHVWLVEPAPQEKPFVLRSKILELVRAAVADALILELVREPALVLGRIGGAGRRALFCRRGCRRSQASGIRVEAVEDARGLVGVLRVVA